MKKFTHFTTTDGVSVPVGKIIYYVSGDEFHTGKVHESFIDHGFNYKPFSHAEAARKPIFSSRDQARKYISFNRKTLSINDAIKFANFIEQSNFTKKRNGNWICVNDGKCELTDIEIFQEFKNLMKWNKKDIGLGGNKNE